MKHLLVSASLLASSVSALHLPFTRRASSGTISRLNTKVLARSSLGVSNWRDFIYTSTVTVDGKDVPVILDTGSADFWLYEYTSGLLNAAAKVNPQLDASVGYAKGDASGYIAQIAIDFAGFHVANQSFLYVQQHHDLSYIDSKEPAVAGLLGLGFDKLSTINTEVMAQFSNETWGRSLLSNIFSSDPSIPNHIAFRLDRLYDNNSTDTGAFDISTFAPGFEAVNDTLELPIFGTEVGYWAVLVDGVAINGENQTLQTSLIQGNTPPTGKLAALLDTGYSLPQITRELAKAIYEPMGGVYVDGDTGYLVPCEAQADLTFYLGGQAIPIHPLDLTFADTKNINNQNMTVCYGKFQPVSSESGVEGVDMILGDAFLRNTYTVYNFGDLVDGISGYSQNSYIKLLPLTDPAAASAEFVNARKAYLQTLPPQLNVSTYSSGNPQAIPGTGTPAALSGATRVGMSMGVAGLAIAFSILCLV